MKNVMLVMVVMLTGCASPHLESHARLQALVAECLQPGQFLRESQPPACRAQVVGNDRTAVLRYRTQARIQGYAK